MKAAKGSGEEYYYPDRKDNILERNKTRLELWEEHLKDPIVALDKALKCVESSCWEGFWARESSGGSDLQWLALAFLRTASMEWNVPGKYGQYGELFFFLIQKEPALAVGETFSPFFNADIRTSLFSADVLKKCALSSCTKSGRGKKAEKLDVVPLIWETNVKCAAPKSPTWESGDEAWSEDEKRVFKWFSRRQCDQRSAACHWVVRPCDKISLFLKDWELTEGGIELPRGPGHVVPGNA